MEIIIAILIILLGINVIMGIMWSRFFLEKQNKYEQWNNKMWETQHQINKEKNEKTHNLE